MQLHHIGVLTNALEAAARGASIVEDRVWGIRSALQRVGDLQVELIGPIALDSWVRHALVRGVIIHHVGFWVPNLDQALQRLFNSGWTIVQQPKPTTLWQARSAFLTSPSRIPVELVELKETQANG